MPRLIARTSAILHLQTYICIHIIHELVPFVK
nr:MAG TPA: hypothetical protein [Caudoviricetes sp.]